MEFVRDYYINREYSWLRFNERVLEQAQARENPLLERCKFLSIFSSNLDEFYMVRVGSLYNQSVVSPSLMENKTRLTASEQLDGIFDETKKLYDKSGEVFENLRKDLKSAGVKLIKAGQMSGEQKLECGQYFSSKILPLLSPMVLDAKHPMIRFENMHSYFMYKLNKGSRSMFGVMPIPARAPRLYRFSCNEKTVALITIEDILRDFGFMAFEGYTASCTALVRVTRNADFDADSSDADSEFDYDFSKYLKEKIEMRSSLAVVRLEIDEDSDDIKEFLLNHLNIKTKQCFTVKSYFDYKFMFSIGSLMSFEEAEALKYPQYKPRIAKEYEGVSLIDYVKNRDIFLSYPYDSFDTLISLLDECSVSKLVVSIKITIYRLDDHSKIVEALKRASEHGIEVTVVIELCARFDEESNLRYAQMLASAGCTIIYGVGNYKVHSKIISIVLADSENNLSYITHLGTGNYNASTAKLYTDLNIITANEQIGRDAATLFRNLSIGNVEDSYSLLLIAPRSLKNGLMDYVERETEKAKRGEKAEILAKMNSLTDLEIIDSLVAAARAGVKIQLIVRGICCLAPRLAGFTENIRIISIVGRLLEHSRVYCFGTAEDRTMFISSADLMTRNTSKRVEIATPVLDKNIENKIYNMLQVMLSDNVKATELKEDCQYHKIETAPPLNSQEYFMSNK